MAERERREASDLRPSAVVFPLVVLAGGVLRFWSLGHGVPFSVGVDEPVIMSAVVRMMKTGDFNPHFFDYPGLYFHLQFLVACVRFLVGASQGVFSSLDQIEPAQFYLWGRALTALLGTATIVVVYRIGLRWGARHALLAAGLLAVMPGHVRESHYVLTDVPATFFVSLTLWLSLAAHEKATARAFAWAGAAAGLATATKYPAGLALLMPLLAVWMTLAAAPSRGRAAVGTLAGFCGAFLLGAPYTILDLPAFLNGFAHLATYYVPRGPGEEPGWLIYLKHLRLGLGWPALLLTFIGLALGVVRAIRGPGRVRWMLLVLFPMLFFYTIAQRPLIFARYLMPIVPFTSILAAIAVVSGVSLLRRFQIGRTPRTALIAAFTITAILPPTWQSVGFLRMIGRPSTQAAAYAWLEQNAPARARIAVERSVLQLPQARFEAEILPRLTDRTYDDYAAGGFDYLIASSTAYGPVLAEPQRHPERHDEYGRLFAAAEEVYRATPTGERTGPEIRILRIRR